MLTLVRHGESEHNKYGVSGRDCGLTALGKDQAREIHGHYELVICSTLRRCRETLAFSRISYDNVIYTDLCREHRTDPCDFFTTEDLGLESEDALLDRIKDFKSFLAEVSVNRKTICVISHADFLFYAHGSHIEDEWFGTWLRNGEVLTTELNKFLPVLPE